ncbi:MAG: hypothetical protein NC388_09515 [Clostridium sp.]|nr:hypothetical protein [Clostridium sp.]
MENVEKSLLNQAWKSVSGYWGRSVWSVVLYGLIWTVLALLIAGLFVAMGNKPREDNQMFGNMVGFGVYIPAMIFGYGLSYFFLSVVRGDERAACGQVFAALKSTREAGTALLHGLYVGLGMVCCYVPGVVLTYVLGMTPFIMRDYPEVSGHDALKCSRTLMKGRKSDLFMWDISVSALYVGAIILEATIVIYGLLPLLGGDEKVGRMIVVGIAAVIFGVILILFWIVRSAMYACFYERAKAAYEAEHGALTGCLTVGREPVE